MSVSGGFGRLSQRTSSTIGASINHSPLPEPGEGRVVTSIPARQRATRGTGAGLVNGQPLTGIVMDAISSLDPCAIPAETLPPLPVIPPSGKTLDGGMGDEREL